MGGQQGDAKRSWVDVLRRIKVPALLTLLVCFLLYALWWGWTNAVAPPRPPSTVVDCATVSPTPLRAESVTVNVYNGGARGGTAGQVAQNLDRAGFTVRTVANTDERIGATVVRAARADAPGALLVASHFSGATVEGDNRPDASVDVLVGKDFAPMVPDAPSETLLPAPGCGPTPSAAPASPTQTP